MEKLQQDSNKSLEEHKKELLGELAAEKEDGERAPADDNPALTEAMTSAVGGSVVAAAVAVREDLSNSKSTSSFFVNAKSKNQSSMFVGGGATVVTNKADRVAPLVPPSYSDKKAAAKTAPRRDRDGDIFARSRVSAMSLTGKSLTGAGSSPIKGVSAKVSDAKAIKIKEIQAELAVVKNVMNNPYENGTKRLINDYNKGVDTAEIAVQRAPEKIKNAAPQASAQFQMKPPTGA